MYMQKRTTFHTVPRDKSISSSTNLKSYNTTKGTQSITLGKVTKEGLPLLLHPKAGHVSLQPLQENTTQQEIQLDLKKKTQLM